MKKKIPPFEIGSANLVRMYQMADAIDIAEGKLAYQKYNIVMRRIVEKYGYTIEGVTAAFCALSPNNDYIGNLRSLISVLQGLSAGVPRDHITVSTYKHCRDRAIQYLTGEEPFIAKNRGMKILSFYRNILDPEDPRYATVDGHIAAAYHGDDDMVMKDAMLTGREYKTILVALKVIANDERLLPNQVQSIIWFTRKRTLDIKYNPMSDLFMPNDPWQILAPIEDLQPYSRTH